MPEALHPALDFLSTNHAQVRDAIVNAHKVICDAKNDAGNALRYLCEHMDLTSIDPVSDASALQELERVLEGSDGTLKTVLSHAAELVTHLRLTMARVRAKKAECLGKALADCAAQTEDSQKE